MKRFLLILAAACLFPVWGLAQSLTITFAGDCTLGGEDRLRRKDYSFDSVIAREGFQYPFAFFEPLFQGDDLTVINLEGVLFDEASGKKDKTYCFRGPTSYTEILRVGGIEAVNLGNNHTGDYGKKGLESTQNALDAAGVNWFLNRNYFIYEKNGIKVAFFGVTSSSYIPNKDWIRDEIQALKAGGVHAVVVTLHFGAEYAPTHNARQASMAKAAVDWGADLVIGHHPHVLQGMEVYNNRTIFYSLGNFCFGGNRTVRALETMAVQVTLDFDENGVYLGQQAALFPAHISGSSPASNYQPVLVQGEEAEKVLALVQNDTSFQLSPYKEGTGAVQPYVKAE